MGFSFDALWKRGAGPAHPKRLNWVEVCFPSGCERRDSSLAGAGAHPVLTSR